ncbi:hypothetical protein ACTXT7_015365 [Hymenolepis weldensis]
MNPFNFFQYHYGLDYDTTSSRKLATPKLAITSTRPNNLIGKVKRADPALRAVEACTILAEEYETIDLDECYQYHYERFKVEIGNATDKDDFDPYKEGIDQSGDLDSWLNFTLSFLAYLVDALVSIYPKQKQNKTM